MKNKKMYVLSYSKVTFQLKNCISDDDCYSCVITSNCQHQKRRPSSSPVDRWFHFCIHFVCMSVLELIGSPLHQRLTHIPLSWCLITPSLFELLKTTHPPNKTSPHFPERDLAWFILHVCMYTNMFCLPFRWMWPGSTGTVWQTLATVIVGGTVSACVHPSLHMHTSAVNRGSQYSGGRPLSVVSRPTHMLNCAAALYFIVLHTRLLTLICLHPCLKYSSIHLCICPILLFIHEIARML